MPITTNKYNVSSVQQMIDLNGDAKNFKLKFTCKGRDDSVPFEVLVMTQAQLDNPDSKNLNYKKINGSITGEIIADKNMYQNYFLLIKSPEDCQIEIVSDFEKLQDNIPPENQHHQHQHQHQHQQPHQHQHQHQQPHQHQHQQPTQSQIKSEEKTPKTDSGTSFLNSSTFLWIVVGIIGLFLVYFIFFYNSGANKPVKIENNKAFALEPLSIMHPTFPALMTKKSSKKKKRSKKHNFDNF